MGKGIIGKVAPLFCLLAMALFSCSTANEEEPELEYTFSPVLGTWVTTSYYSSGGYFVPSTVEESFVFEENQTYTHNNGGTIHTGTFFFNRETNFLHCEESKGWNLDIIVSFDGDNKATFDITGRTENQSKIIKVERKTSPQ